MLGLVFGPYAVGKGLRDNWRVSFGLLLSLIWPWTECGTLFCQNKCENVQFYLWWSTVKPVMIKKATSKWKVNTEVMLWDNTLTAVFGNVFVSRGFSLMFCCVISFSRCVISLSDAIFGVGETTLAAGNAYDWCTNDFLVFFWNITYTQINYTWYIILQYLHYFLICKLKGLHSELKEMKSSAMH